MTFEQFLNELRSPLKGERLGQRAFNLLHQHNSHLAESIRNEAYINPFHRNSNMERFLSHVKEHWDD